MSQSYGEQGFVIIYRILCSLFPTEDIDLAVVAPLSPSDFLQRVLVPECAMALIREDGGPHTSQSEALKIMHESSKFGAAMYPDLDSSGGAGDMTYDSSGHGIGEAMLKDQARKNRSTALADQKLRVDNGKPSGIHSRSTSSSMTARETRRPSPGGPIVVDSDGRDNRKREERPRYTKQTMVLSSKKSRSKGVVCITSSDDDERPT